MPFSVGIELMLIAHRRTPSQVDMLGAVAQWFIVEREEVLFTAARALDIGQLHTVFDAVHAADAWHRSLPLRTADAALLRSPFPTKAF